MGTSSVSRITTGFKYPSTDMDCSVVNPATKVKRFIFFFLTSINQLITLFRTTWNIIRYFAQHTYRYTYFMHNHLVYFLFQEGCTVCQKSILVSWSPGMGIASDVTLPLWILLCASEWTVGALRGRKSELTWFESPKRRQHANRFVYKLCHVTHA